ncbi:hypothetical protein JCM3770_005783 [Rhodotorula araucariae]
MMADIQPVTAERSASPPRRASVEPSPAPLPAQELAEPATDGLATDGTPPPAAPAPAPAEDPATAGMATTRKAPDSPTETDEQRADKKRKLDALKQESRQRGARMFGVMMGTLQRAKREVSKVEQTDAGRKRAELQERLREKLSAERREAQDKAKREREAKELKLDILRREEELASADAIFRTRHAAKLASARFLCTTFSAPTPSTSSDGIPPPFAPRLPHAVKLTDPRAPRPIYYLPYRLLPSQEDRLEDQLETVTRARDAERAAWDEQRRAKVRELDELRRRRGEREQEMERRDREERQRRRREAEEREEKERKAHRRSRSPSRSGAGDEPMAVERSERSAGEAPKDKENGDAASPSPEAKEDQAPVPAGEDAAMDGDKAQEQQLAAAVGADPAPASVNGGAGDNAEAGVSTPSDAKMDDELEY